MGKLDERLELYYNERMKKFIYVIEYDLDRFKLSFLRNKLVINKTVNTDEIKISIQFILFSYSLSNNIAFGLQAKRKIIDEAIGYSLSQLRNYLQINANWIRENYWMFDDE